MFVVAGLGTAWFMQTRRALWGEIDADLLAAARVLDGSLRGIPLPGVDQAATAPVTLSPDNDRRLSLPRIPNPVQAAPRKPARYFVIWLEDGRVLKSERLPDEAPPAFDHTLRGVDTRVRRRGDARELRIVGPSGTQILVGRDVRGERAMLRRLTLQISAVSIGILSVGLVGGWWLSRSVVRPIEAMANTATRFSVADMTPRIDVVETDTELGELAGILNRAFDRVQLSFEQQRRFAADASHELRTPLAVIQSQVELALKKPRRPEEYVKALTTCADAGERLSELVESLLTLARLDASESQSPSSPLRLDRIAAKCTDLMRPVAEHAEVTLTAETTAASVLGDPQQLERAILNLLKNSILYNRPGGSVTLTVQVAESSAELVVRDTGVGISAEHLPRVAERFYRVDKARSRQGGGSGLGLSIAKQVFVTHRATFDISSQPEHGTTVTVRFPRCQ